MPNIHTTPRTLHEIVIGSKFNFLIDILRRFGAPILAEGGDVTKHQNPANAQGVCLGGAPETKEGALTLLHNGTRRCMSYSKEGIAYRISGLIESL
jgi:hypothetical protein